VTTCAYPASHGKSGLPGESARDLADWKPSNPSYQELVPENCHISGSNCPR
jgi:hypothetical protein